MYSIYPDSHRQFTDSEMPPVLPRLDKVLTADLAAHAYSPQTSEKLIFDLLSHTLFKNFLTKHLLLRIIL